MSCSRTVQTDVAHGSHHIGILLWSVALTNRSYIYETVLYLLLLVKVDRLNRQVTVDDVTWFSFITLDLAK